MSCNTYLVPKCCNSPSTTASCLQTSHPLHRRLATNIIPPFPPSPTITSGWDNFRVNEVKRWPTRCTLTARVTATMLTTVMSSSRCPHSAASHKKKDCKATTPSCSACGGNHEFTSPPVLLGLLPVEDSTKKRELQKTTTKQSTNKTSTEMKTP